MHVNYWNISKPSVNAKMKCVTCLFSMIFSNLYMILYDKKCHCHVSAFFLRYLDRRLEQLGVLLDALDPREEAFLRWGYPTLFGRQARKALAYYCRKDFINSREQ